MDDKSYYVSQHRSVGLLYIENTNFLSLRCIVRSKMLISSYSSFSIVNFTDDCTLMTSLSVCSMLVLVGYYERVVAISEISDYLLFLLGLDVCVYVPCAVYILVMLGHPWLTCRCVSSIAGQIGSSLFHHCLHYVYYFFPDIHVNF
jgi:hypothetical protein